MGWFGRKKKKKDAKSESTISLCMVLSPDEKPVDHAVYTTIAKKIRGLTLSDEAGSDPDGDGDASVVSFDQGDTRIFVAHMPLAVPTDEAETAADNYPFWPEGREEVKKHRSHYLVTAMGAGSMHESVSQLINFVREFIQCFNAIGVYWGNGSIANSTVAFLEWSEDASPESLPLNLFMRFQFVGDENGMGLYMLGMEQFGLMNIEVESSPMEPMELMEFVYNVAHYLVQSGPVIEDGNTVGGSEEEKILVRHKESMLGNGEKVYQICFE